MGDAEKPMPSKRRQRQSADEREGNLCEVGMKSWGQQRDRLFACVCVRVLCRCSSRVCRDLQRERPLMLMITFRHCLEVAGVAVQAVKLICCKLESLWFIHGDSDWSITKVNVARYLESSRVYMKIWTLSSHACFVWIIVDNINQATIRSESGTCRHYTTIS